MSNSATRRTFDPKRLIDLIGGILMGAMSGVLLLSIVGRPQSHSPDAQAHTMRLLLITGGISGALLGGSIALCKNWPSLPRQAACIAGVLLFCIGASYLTLRFLPPPPDRTHVGHYLTLKDGMTRLEVEQHLGKPANLIEGNKHTWEGRNLIHVWFDKGDKLDKKRFYER